MRTLFAALVAVSVSASAAFACEHDPNAQNNTSQAPDQQNQKKKAADAKSDKKAPAKDDQRKS